jgi:Ran-binding protein 9/10
VLIENPDIVFRLKCRKWIELISKTTELNMRKSTASQDRRSGNSAEKASTADDDFIQDMELDGESRGNGLGPTTLQHDQLLQEVMLYGQELHREFQHEDGEHAKALQDIFSLVAYNDPKGSVHGHLLDPSGRSTVAEELNSAILGKDTPHRIHFAC